MTRSNSLTRGSPLMKHPILGAVAIVGAVAAGVLIALLSSAANSRAVQNPTISLDMVPAGNSYDDATNTMSISAIDNCLSSTTAQTSTHTHSAQFAIQNVEDLVGWQARLNYVGDQMRPSAVNFGPFVDNSTGQNVSFVNLPLDGGIHRDLISATNIPPAAPGPQSALIGSVYLGAPTFAVSPDTPAKTTPDDSSYSAPSGGVLATLNIQVVGDQSGKNLTMDLSSVADVNLPGSKVLVFDGAGIATIVVPESALGDGFHGEGVACPEPSPSPTPLAALDAKLKKISVSSSVVLSDGTPDDKNVAIQVRNEGDHPESIGVYADILPPAAGVVYGCTPIDRIIDTVVFLAPGEQAVVSASPTFDCRDAEGARGQTYTVVAAADAHADDGDACRLFEIQTTTCFLALSDDDNDNSDNRLVVSGFAVK
jgi:hypothetical protein